ncbi:uncharacterized protein LOC134509713 isoform X2 [Chroicocephalus ridibundus]|uniref:uncharacterized protein LOC134509713 isoform X2 n=1 Tax=Chroicocephalus ridibundus TaxID=1192867 RepID=UPI002FDE61CD
MVEDCMRDTILLYSFQLRKKQHLSFAFKDIGVLSCQDGVLCMRFYYDYVTGLESKASRMALLHTRLWVRCAVVSGGAATTWGMQAAPDRMFPSFRFVVISTVVVEALANQHKKAAEQQRIRRGTVWHPEKLLQSFPSPCCQARVQAEGSKTWGRRLLPGSTVRTKHAQSCACARRRCQAQLGLMATVPASCPGQEDVEHPLWYMQLGQHSEQLA